MREKITRRCTWLGIGVVVPASLGAAVAIGLLVGMAPAAESGAVAVPYGAMVLLCVALTFTCLVVQRTLLWRLPYCHPRSAHHA
ncbi:hypothetical protein SAMN06265360_11454 [Haloechinothrix alba]|uniref:Uncharacterized protein n=1 Tax=Haloechinothrix alba TaxID=664784 RepID=A0A238YA51_9PSEU|nr:hypothetical protein [Haloechinothrix alba]SNR67474.1 hypothetical protein SAMN06265360_11454 [Haloechinothrix alba]